MRLEALIASAGRSLLSELPRVCVTAWPDSAVSVLFCGFFWGWVRLRGMLPVYRGVCEGLGASFCSHVQEYSVGLCVGVCAWVSMTRRKYLFSVTLVTFLKNISSTKT